MKLTFHGAAREVTGSCHEVQTDRAHLQPETASLRDSQDRKSTTRFPQLSTAAHGGWNRRNKLWRVSWSWIHYDVITL